MNAGRPDGERGLLGARGVTFRMRQPVRRRGWWAAVLTAVLGATMLLASPALAQTGSGPTVIERSSAVTNVAVENRPGIAGAVPAAAVVPQTADVHAVVLAEKQPKKKVGFFKKLGIFLIVLLVVFLLIIVLVIWLIVHFVRKAFRRRSAA